MIFFWRIIKNFQSSMNTIYIYSLWVSVTHWRIWIQFFDISVRGKKAGASLFPDIKPVCARGEKLYVLSSKYCLCSVFVYRAEIRESGSSTSLFNDKARGMNIVVTAVRNLRKWRGGDFIPPLQPNWRSSWMKGSWTFDQHKCFYLSHSFELNEKKKKSFIPHFWLYGQRYIIINIQFDVW